MILDMKFVKVIKTLSLSILLCFSASSFAKDYIVEMILFSNTQPLSESAIYVSSLPVYPNLQGAISLNDNANSNGFILLPQEVMTLTNKATALNQSGRYKVLQHVSWLQPGLAKEDAIPVLVQAGKNFENEFKERTYDQFNYSDQNPIAPQPINEIDGTVKIVLGRYLHVYTDLAYRRPINISVDSEENPLGREQILADFAIKSHRKMRSKELHYIDHPLLGILIEIRPVEESSIEDS